MAIKPSSDIVLEVLKAADPLRAQATTQRLSALGGASVGGADDFARVLDATEQSDAGVGDADVVTNAANMRDRLPGLTLAATDDQKAARTQVEFEASILKSFVDEILPKNETSIYGEGEAGDIWRSMLGDQIARQIAKSGSFGIAKQLFATHPLPGRHPLVASNVIADGAIGGAQNGVDGALRHGASLSRTSNRS